MYQLSATLKLPKFQYNLSIFLILNAHVERKKSKCDYDCACIGAHVSNTSEVGQFKIISHDFNDGIWRVRWKVIV